jgi:hypothetical protein
MLEEVDRKQEIVERHLSTVLDARAKTNEGIIKLMNAALKDGKIKADVHLASWKGSRPGSEWIRKRPSTWMVNRRSNLLSDILKIPNPSGKN